jgi:hypothetical protein
MINQDEYENSLPDFTVRSLVNEKIIPRKINENNRNKIIIRYFFTTV